MIFPTLTVASKFDNQLTCCKNRGVAFGYPGVDLPFL